MLRVDRGADCAYMAQLCRRSAIEGGSSVQASILCSQEAQRSSHAETCHPNLSRDSPAIGAFPRTGRKSFRTCTNARRGAEAISCCALEA